MMAHAPRNALTAPRPAVVAPDAVAVAPAALAGHDRWVGIFVLLVGLSVNVGLFCVLGFKPTTTSAAPPPVSPPTRDLVVATWIAPTPPPEPTPAPPVPAVTLPEARPEPTTLTNQLKPLDNFHKPEPARRPEPPRSARAQPTQAPVTPAPQAAPQIAHPAAAPSIMNPVGSPSGEGPAQPADGLAPAGTSAARSEAGPSTGAPGTTPPAGGPPTRSAPSTQAISAWAGRITALFRARIRYPRQAEPDELEGVVHLRLAVAGDGTLTDVVVHKSSGEPLLDREAVAQARAIGKLPSPPEAEARVIEVPVSFQLPHHR